MRCRVCNTWGPVASSPGNALALLRNGSGSPQVRVGTIAEIARNHAERKKTIQIRQAMSKPHLMMKPQITQKEPKTASEVAMQQSLADQTISQARAAAAEAMRAAIEQKIGFGAGGWDSLLPAQQFQNQNQLIPNPYPDYYGYIGDGVTPHPNSYTSDYASMMPSPFEQLRRAQEAAQRRIQQVVRQAPIKPFEVPDNEERDFDF